MIPAWHARAKCHGDWYFVDRIEDLAPRKRREAARAACAGCPVIRACAAEAIDTKAKQVVRAGIWVRANDRNITLTPDRVALEAVADRPDPAPTQPAPRALVAQA